MCMNFVKKTLILLLFVLFLPKIYSQDRDQSKSMYNWFDKTLGVGNIGIYNGIEYKKEYYTKKGNDEFFMSSDFLVGDVVYNTQPYFNILMKYDVFKDRLIVKLPSQNSFITIYLIKSKVENFKINEVYFTKLSIDSSKKNIGFYAVLFEDDYLKTYKKYKKNRKEHLDDGYVYNVFKMEIDYYMFYNNEYFIINSKKDFIKLFPKYRKEIVAFTNENRSLRKSNYDNYSVQLTRIISDLLASNNQNL